MAVLASHAEISANYLSRIETGTRRRVRPSAYSALRDALGATDQQLLGSVEQLQEGTLT